MITVPTKNVYLTQRDFELELEICLTIIEHPTNKNPYYVCEYISYALYKSTVNIYIKDGK